MTIGTGQLLTRDLAQARFAAVAVVEVFALGICFMPLVFRSEQWQHDCFRIGFSATVIALLACVGAFAVAALMPSRASDDRVTRRLEWGITGIYILNVATLVLVTARTGGPTSSLYGTLVPVQLSAMLFMQMQKERLTGRGSFRAAMLYVGIALGGHLAAHYLRGQIASLPIFTPDVQPPDWIAANATWTAWLTVFAMLLSFVTYAVPSDDRFIAKVRALYERRDSTIGGAG